MTLLTRMCSLMQPWSKVFKQNRTLLRAMEHAVAAPCSLGRRTISRAICVLDRHQQDWSSDYKIFSRSEWDAEKLFEPVIEQYRGRYPGAAIVIGLDDTKLPRTSKKIKTVFRQRDPMSPAFHANLILAQRFIQASLLFPLHSEGDYDARGVPVCFREAPVIKKAPKNAPLEARIASRKARKEFNLSTQTLKVITDIRKQLDAAGARNQEMRCVLDGSFCNRTIFGANFERIHLIARCRKDAKLCWPATNGRRKYDSHTFTPQEIRKDDAVPWCSASVFYGGTWRKIKCKELTNVLWRRGSKTKPLRVIAIAPQPYKTSKNARYVNYREPAYLLTTDLHSPLDVILQAYFDRWQIEVNHREEKSILGVGQAQVFSPKSSSRHPVFRVASYSMMLLAAMQQFGPTRTEQFVPLPKWRKHARRPSALDIICLLRKLMNETQISEMVTVSFKKNALEYAYT